ncbi:aromatic motif membrane protein [Mycoplasma sp. 'Moose RK']|uniref:aromatic motif membrane protein n=1 Tax=Mycoplasma sp. 'Moose RK' TaxID=2780095 RepID=UPI0018C1DFCB|nr:aromatic motif membrane protein [Mycoplasma sp. 'Moose RK']MBG0730773.1 hypothetical protein [Mycoplasma sp. 'Moose RK']
MPKKIILATILSTTGLFLASCSSIYQFYKFENKQENRELVENQSIQDLLDSVFSGDKTTKNNYIINQNSLDPGKVSAELKYSLVFSRPYFISSFYDEYQQTRQNSNFTIHSYLAKNWLFLLSHIDKLGFIFNPYHSRFVKNPNEIKVEKAPLKNIKILDKNFDFIKIVKNYVADNENTTYYLIFEKTKFIRFTVVKHKNTIKTKLDYNLFVLDKEPADKFLFARSFENWIDNKENEYFEKELARQKQELEYDFVEKRDEIQQKINLLENPDMAEDENEENFCSLENIDKCTEEQKKFLLKTNRGSSSLLASTTAFQDNSNSNSLKDLQNQLKNLESQHQANLNNLEKTVKNKLLMEKNDTTASNFFTDITTDTTGFESPFPFQKYSLTSIDLQQTTKNEVILPQKLAKKSFYFSKYEKFIDKKLDVQAPFETEEEYKNRLVYDTIFNFIWPNDEKAKVAFLNEFEKAENLKKLENEWKKIQENLKKSNKSAESLNEYKSFVNKNWFFILKRLGKMNLHFHNWFLLPDQFNTDGSIKVGHSDAFKQSILELAPLNDDLLITDSLLEEISEGDTTKSISNYKDLYILKQNALINLKVDTSSRTPKVTLNPFVLYFPKSKHKISVKILTEIFHQALYHASKESYFDFEKSLVKKFRYNNPAQMIFKDK